MGVLHRNISIENIFLFDSDSLPVERRDESRTAVLVNFDMAIHYRTQEGLVEASNPQDVSPSARSSYIRLSAY